MKHADVKTNGRHTERRQAGLPRSDLERAITRAAAAALQSERAGLERYDRARVLPRLIALDPRELGDAGEEARSRIAARLTRALRAERRRGVAGHWAYDLNRHIALTQALAAEKRSL